MKTVKKIMALVLMLSMILSVASINVLAEGEETETPTLFSGGSGTEADPYLLSKPADLVQLENLTNTGSDYTDKYYVLTNNIDMDGVTFNGISKCEDENGDWIASTGFSGTIDGKGHIIENMTIARNTTGNNAANIFGALVSRANGCTVKNLGLVNASVSAKQTVSAFIGGRFGSAVTLENCFVKNLTLSTTTAGAVNSRKQSAALIACTVANSVIKNCYSLNVTGTSEGCAMGDYSSSAYKQSTAENVYSTGRFFDNRGITHTNPLQYIDDATDAEIAAFIAASNGAFEADIYEINNGYPVLAWENDFFSGNGTESDPYLLSTAEDLVTLSALTNKNTDAYNAFDSAYYKLTADIDMAGIEGFLGISPMRNEETGAYSNTGSFKGVLDGNYHTISNMTANASNSAGYSALVPYAGGCTIKNLGLINPVLTGDTRAGFACCRMGGATIDGCFVKGLAYISASETQYAFTAYKNANIRITNSYCTDNGIGAYQGNSSTLAAEISNVFTWNGGISSYANVYNNNLNSVGDNRSVEKTNAFIAASNGAFEKPNGVDSTKPVLWWENTGVYMEMDHAEQAVSLENRQHIIPNGVLIVAAYTSAEEMLEVVYFKNLSELSIGEYDTVTVNYDLADGATRYKAFVWSSLDELVPLCASEAYPPAA